MGRLEDVFKMDKPTIDIVYLGSLPGSSKYDPVDMGMNKIISIALEETTILGQTGIDSVQVENMWDIPCLHNESIGYGTVAALAIGTHAIHDKVSIPAGAGCHMNGVDCVVAYVVVTGASWIRVLEWCSAFVSQSSFINAMDTNMSRMRSRLRADQILALCDVNVKHGSYYTTHDQSVAEQAMDIESQNGDAVIVTGFDMGTPPSAENISKCKKSTSLPILVGSGLNNSNMNELLTTADGTIIRS